MTQKKDTKKILVVDDEQSMCSMLVKFLRSAGYNCDSTTDPINALSMLQRDGF
jgi:DNA-binding response OmpR family regulator